jgi:hypothetical protein
VLPFSYARYPSTCGDRPAPRTRSSYEAPGDPEREVDTGTSDRRLAVMLFSKVLRVRPGKLAVVRSRVAGMICGMALDLALLGMLLGGQLFQYWQFSQQSIISEMPNCR